MWRNARAARCGRSSRQLRLRWLIDSWIFPRRVRQRGRLTDSVSPSQYGLDVLLLDGRRTARSRPTVWRLKEQLQRWVLPCYIRLRMLGFAARGLPSAKRAVAPLRDVRGRQSTGPRGILPCHPHGGAYLACCCPVDVGLKSAARANFLTTHQVDSRIPLSI